VFEFPVGGGGKLNIRYFLWPQQKKNLPAEGENPLLTYKQKSIISCIIAIYLKCFFKITKAHHEILYYAYKYV